MEGDEAEEAGYDEGYRVGYMAGYTDGLLARSYALHEKDKKSEAKPYNEGPGTYTWTLDEIREALAHLDDLRAKGEIPPLKRYIAMDWVKKDKHGKYYVASEEQLQEELALQRHASIDPDGNLVQDGQIVKYGWLQSFAKKDL